MIYTKQMISLVTLMMALPLVAQEVAPAVESGAANPIPLESKDSFYDTYIANRLSLGLTYVNTSLDKTHVPFDPDGQSNFLGYINNLTEDDMSGIGLVVRYELFRYAALQFSTGTKMSLGMWNHEHESCDAEFDVKGMTYEVLLMYPFDDIYLTPYIGLGITQYSFSVDYNNWWHYGWQSPADYAEHGNSIDTTTRRWMLLDEPSAAFTFSAGLTFDLWDHVQLDAFYRMASPDDCKIDFRRQELGHSRHHVRSGYVPMKYSSFGIALLGEF